MLHPLYPTKSRAMPPHLTVYVYIAERTTKFTLTLTDWSRTHSRDVYTNQKTPGFQAKEMTLILLVHSNYVTSPFQGIIKRQPRIFICPHHNNINN